MSNAKGQVAPKPEAVIVSAEQRVALEALRAAALAVHNAAGLCRAAQLPSAARTSRVAEGMVRSAISLVQAAVGKAVPCAQASAASAAHAAASTTNAAERKKKENSLAKCKVKGTDKVSQDMDVDAARARPRRRGRRQRANAATLVRPDASDAPAVRETDDEWADGLSGRKPVAAVSAAAASALVSPARPPGADAISDGEPRARSCGEARASHSRSPRREGPHGHVAAGPSGAAAAHHIKGAIAGITHLDARPELDGKLVDLTDYDQAAGRWRCKLQSGEMLRIQPAKLQGVHSRFQETTRRRFESGD